MSDELRLAAGFLLALGTTAIATPPVMRIATTAGLLDRPTGWKSHGRPTPYLGGAAVMAGFLLAAISFGGAASRFAAIAGGAVLLFAVGVLDDRSRLPVRPRLAAEVGAAVLLWLAGLGWSLSSSEPVNLALTVVWILGVVNALNLLDLMDGVATAVAAVSAATVGVLAAIQGDPVVGALAACLAGACCGFLPYNLARPSRIFLGDCGSKPIGFVVGAAIMSVPLAPEIHWSALGAAGVLLGVAFLDMAFRIVLRLGRGISLMTGGPDSLANRLESRLGSARQVTAVAAVAQAALGVLVIAAVQEGSRAVVATAAACGAVGACFAAILQLLSRAEDRTTRPDGLGRESSY